MTVLPGVERQGEGLACAAEELAWRAARAKVAGVKLGAEPHLGSVAPTPEAARELAARAPGLDLTLDYTHFGAQGIAEAEAEALLSLAGHFHARGARPGRIQCRMRDNTIDYSRAARAMRGARYPGVFALEYVWIEWQQCQDLDILSETVLLRDEVASWLSDSQAST